jgi:S-adenosylmethionine-diacylglycerol 3-amino-3-carboxypropyl transferase
LISNTQVFENTRLRSAVCRSRPLSRQGLLENLFAYAFRGMVYPQIWEDPEVDLEALAITTECEVVAIASGGCNILSYLTADPKHITAIDLNKAHVALTRLKLAAVTHLPSWTAFFRFFGKADDETNLNAYFYYLAPRLDDATRAYWETRAARGLGSRRISLFSRNLYRHGLLGRFISLSHAFAKLYGVDPKKFLQSASLDEQRKYFKTAFAPLFEKRFVRWTATWQMSLYGLGIPPAQYAALAGGGDVANVLRSRLEKLTCDFSLSENYFSWQAFGRTYAEDGPLPLYLKREHFADIRARARSVDVQNGSLTEHLATRPSQSLDRYVLLDAQDWMNDAQLNTLWSEITRTARARARVIFRTAAEASLLPGRLDPAILDRWRYDTATSRRLTARDRSAIYGGFHLYVYAE